MIVKTQEKVIIKDEDRDFTNCEIDGSSTIIFDILTKKLYSDPIGSIVREYTCNAIDANVEAGRGEMPVKLKITQANPLLGNSMTFSVIDNGVGISPERMWNVFAKYTASTKRDTNEQIGGFGLGSKTFFAYGDSFFIHTWVNGTEYLYKAFKDETNKPAIELLWEDSYDVNDRTNGTEILGLIKSDSDRHKFIEAVNKQLAFVPNIEVEGFIRNNIVIEEETEDFVTTDTWFGVGVLIGNIFYPASVSTCFTGYVKDKYKVGHWANWNIIPKFKVGEIAVTASRESVEFDSNNNTKNAINEKLHKILDYYYDKAIEEYNKITPVELYDYFLGSQPFARTLIDRWDLYASLSDPKYMSLKNAINRVYPGYSVINIPSDSVKQALIDGKSIVYVFAPESWNKTGGRRTRKHLAYLEYIERYSDKLVITHHGKDHLLYHLFNYLNYKEYSSLRKLTDIKDYFLPHLTAIKEYLALKGISVHMTDIETISQDPEYKEIYKETEAEEYETVEVDETSTEILTCVKHYDPSIKWIKKDEYDGLKVYVEKSNKKLARQMMTHIFKLDEKQITKLGFKDRITLIVPYKKEIDSLREQGFISIEEYIDQVFKPLYKEDIVLKFLSDFRYQIQYSAEYKMLSGSSYTELRDRVWKFFRHGSYTFDQHKSKFQDYCKKRFDKVIESEPIEEAWNKHKFTYLRMIQYQREIHKNVADNKRSYIYNQIFNESAFKQYKSELPAEVIDLFNKFIELKSN